MILLACLQVELIDELTMNSINSNSKTDLKHNYFYTFTISTKTHMQ